MIGPKDWRGRLSQSFAKLKQSRLGHSRFLRFMQFARFHFEFSLANDVNLCSDWSPGLLWFWIFNTQLKAALSIEYD